MNDSFMIQTGNIIGTGVNFIGEMLKVNSTITNLYLNSKK